MNEKKACVKYFKIDLPEEVKENYIVKHAVKEAMKRHKEKDEFTRMAEELEANIHAKETKDAFIFAVIYPFCIDVIGEISKREIEQALIKSRGQKPLCVGSEYPFNDTYYCPVCKERVAYFGSNPWKNKYCTECGQKIDWEALE